MSSREMSQGAVTFLEGLTFEPQWQDIESFGGGGVVLSRNEACCRVCDRN